VVKLVYTPDLGSGASRRGGSSPLIRTTHNIQQTPMKPYFDTLWETFEKLNKTEKLLTEYSLYNTKYLLLRNNVYYFVIRLDNKTTFKKSLHTVNLTFAIILKLKILNRLNKMGLKDKGYITHLGSNSLNLAAENEEEEKLLKEIEKTLVSKIKRLSKNHSVAIETDESRDTNTLKKLTDEYIIFRGKIKTSQKVIMKFKQASEYLIIYFREKKLVKDITTKDNMDFQTFLLSVPKHWKNKADLKGKDLKLIYDKSPKMLDKHEKQNISTVNEVLKKIVTIFTFFEENTYIYKNPFKKVSNTVKRELTDKRDFKEDELKRVFEYLKTKNMMEEYRYIKFMLYTGLRRGESLTITKTDINFIKSMIDIDGTKTKNAKRISIIHKDIVNDLNTQLEGKSDNDYLFFNSGLTEKYRNERVGNKLNAIIKEVLGEEIKKLVDLQSLRKNYSQTVFLSDEFDNLSIKTLMGHSTKGDVTDTHYLLGKRDWKKLKEKMDKVDFSD
jgi:integrase